MSAQLHSFEWTEVPLDGGWNAGVLRVDSFPVASELRPSYARVTTSLLRALPASPTMLFIQFHKLLPGEDVACLQRHARLWMPQTGLGVWPDRDPPTLWTREEFEEAEPGKIRPLMYKVMRVADELKAQTHAWDTLIGRGCVLRIGANTGPFLAAAQRALLPRIEHPSFNSFPYYVPLLEAKTVQSASQGDLNAWLSGASFYLRESAEDGGLLVLSRLRTESLLHRLGGTRSASGTSWSIA